MLRPLRELLASLAWLEPVVDLARTAIFVAFVILGLLVARAWTRRRHERRWTNALLIYSMTVSFAVGLIQIESWPFSNWALVWARAPETMASWDVEAIDDDGRVWRLDMRVVQPLGIEDFGAWFHSRFPGLEEEGKAEVSRFVLGRAETQRRRIQQGNPRFPNERLLGRYAAPHHFYHRTVWQSSADVPSTPFRRIRWWRLDWNVAERELNPEAVERQMIYEWPHD